VNEPNPYEPPQTIEPVQKVIERRVVVTSQPNWKLVARGANECRTAVWAGDVTFLLSVIVYLCPDYGKNTSQLVSVFVSGLVMLAIFSSIFALFQHFAGLQDLRFVGSDSPAYGMTRVALILLILAFVMPVAGLVFSILEPPSSVVRVFPNGDRFLTPLSGLLYFFYNVVLFGALKRIGQQLEEAQIVKFAKYGRIAAAIAFGLFILAVVEFATQSIRPSDKSYFATSLFVYFAFTPSFIYYYRALKLIAQRAETLIDPSAHHL
jgi:hypothetical protein